MSSAHNPKATYNHCRLSLRRDWTLWQALVFWWVALSLNVYEYKYVIKHRLAMKPIPSLAVATTFRLEDYTEKVEHIDIAASCKTTFGLEDSGASLSSSPDSKSLKPQKSNTSMHYLGCVRDSTAPFETHLSSSSSRSLMVDTIRFRTCALLLEPALSIQMEVNTADEQTVISSG